MGSSDGQWGCLLGHRRRRAQYETGELNVQRERCLILLLIILIYLQKYVIMDTFLTFILFPKDPREAAFMAVWREEVVKKLGYKYQQISIIPQISTHIYNATNIFYRRWKSLATTSGWPGRQRGTNQTRRRIDWCLIMLIKVYSWSC